MRFRLHTLMIVLALGPPVLAWYGWPALLEWRVQERLAIAPHGKPYLATHSVGRTDPQLAFRIASTLLADTPDTRISLDNNTGKLWVKASPSVHKTIQTTIWELEPCTAYPQEKR